MLKVVTKSSKVSLIWQSKYKFKQIKTRLITYEMILLDHCLYLCLYIMIKSTYALVGQLWLCWLHTAFFHMYFNINIWGSFVVFQVLVCNIHDNSTHIKCQRNNDCNSHLLFLTNFIFYLIAKFYKFIFYVWLWTNCDFDPNSWIHEMKYLNW